MSSKSVCLRCDDNAEAVVFIKYKGKDNGTSYEIMVEDSYCGGDFMGIKGRFKRAWRAFFAKPICFTGIYCDDKDRVQNFLEECLSLILVGGSDEHENN